MKRLGLIAALIVAGLAGAATLAGAQSVFIVDIDGLRYSEGFGKKDTNMPRLWNDLRPQGTFFTNFRNEGYTITNPGHASFLTGEYEQLKNDGSERPHHPTIFEYYRATKKLGDTCCAVVPGKPKLQILTHSDDKEYGEKYGAKYYMVPEMSDTATYTVLRRAMADHPRLVIVNLPSVDVMGHDSNWTGYIKAIRTADSLVYLIWNAIQADPFYRGSTTMFVSSDHGRHDEAHGGFQHHGDSCEGCRHITGLALGRGFTAGVTVSKPVVQTDVRQAVADLLSIKLPKPRPNVLLTDEP